LSFHFPVRYNYTGLLRGITPLNFRVNGFSRNVPCVYFLASDRKPFR
jgi:hypothetical protein